MTGVISVFNGTYIALYYPQSDFRDSLLTIPGISAYVFPDSGTIPYPDSTLGHYHNEAAQFFLYEQDSDYDEAGEILRRYSQTIIFGHMGVDIYLMNYRNKQFQS